MVDGKINFCRSFVRSKCPHQKAMERVYLIPHLLESAQFREYRNICLNCQQSLQDTRRDLRMPVCFLVCCREPEMARLLGTAYNLSVGGVAIKTNYPIGKGERLTLEFFQPRTFTPITLEGQVVWRQFHGDTAFGNEEALFTAGIKFQRLKEPARTAILESIRN